MIVDVHSHIATRDLLDYLVEHPGNGAEIKKDGAGYTFVGYGPLNPPIYEIELRLEVLRKRGIDLQLVGTFNPLLHWPGGAPDVAFSRFVNQETAKAVAEGEGRLAGMATIAFGASQLCADELRRAVGEYGFKGAHIGISGGVAYLDEPVYEDLWSVAEELGLFLYMHPAYEQGYERCQKYSLETIILYPTETCVSVSRMIFAGVFERHPRLNLCLAHGGGTLPALGARLDRAYAATEHEYNADCHKHISKPPSAYFKQLAFDTCVFGAAHLSFLSDYLGTERLMFGTDYPFEIGDTEGELARPWIEALPKVDADKVFGGNALAILDAARTS